MHPLSILLILVTAGAAHAVYGHPAAAGTPAARFWEEALPGTPMPESIATLVQEGIDHSPLMEHYSDFVPSGDMAELYKVYMNPTSKATAVAVPAGLFFLEAQLQLGGRMTILFEPATVRPVLPRDVAQKVPFGDLADALGRFKIAPGSPQAAVMGMTVRLCQAPLPADGQKKACTTSLEGAVESAMEMLGGGGTNQGEQVMWAASSVLPRAGLPLQQYVVQAVTPLDGDRHVACHNMPYPYAVYYCHSTGSPTKAYQVLLRGLSGGPHQLITMATICHLNTSNWDPEHPAFKMLHTQPGGAPVCHSISYASLLFGQKAATPSV
ncbi:hypothetical protein BS78_08G121700 [Paspalum vaginatum]|nr:hypothetical protein BS78_08G121700 [Paspalum vaginatum]